MSINNPNKLTSAINNFVNELISSFADSNLNKIEANVLAGKILDVCSNWKLGAFFENQGYLKQSVSDLKGESNKPWKNVATIIACYAWSESLKTLIFPDKNDFKCADFYNSFKNLEKLIIRKPINLTSDKLMNLSRKLSPSLKYLAISDCPELNDDFLFSIAETCPNLEVLDIQGAKITDKGLIILGIMLGKKIKKLNLAWCTAITQVPDSFVNLERLSLKRTEIKMQALIPLGEGSGKTLKVLDLSGSWSWVRGSWRSTLFTKIASSFVALEELDLSYNHVTDEMLISFGKGSGETLKILDLTGCSHLTVPTSLVKLKALALTFNENINNEALISIGESCGKTLEVLEMAHCKKVTKVPKSFVNLKQVNLNFSGAIEEELSSLVEGSGKTLEAISLSCINTSHNIIRKDRVLKFLQPLFLSNVPDVKIASICDF